jgi:DNA-binding FrmR family transcriptional regulator
MALTRRAADMDTDISPQLVQRLRSAEGHLQAISRQIEIEPAGEDTLFQLGAVRAALQAAENVLIQATVQECTDRIKSAQDSELRQEELKKLVRLYHSHCCR